MRAMASLKVERTCAESGANAPRLTRTERQHVGLASTKGAQYFRCITCQKEITKGGAFKHFTRKKHGLDPEQVKQWVVCADGTALRNKRPHKMTLSSELAKREDVVDVLDSDDEVHLIAQQLPIPRSWTGCLHTPTEHATKLALRRVTRKSATVPQ